MLSLAPSESTPLWLRVAAKQAARRTPANVLRQFGEDTFVAPSQLDLRLVNALDQSALAAAASFDALLLSPVAPLGTCSVLAPTHQDRILTANRGTEVVSDPTNVLALVCAQRLTRQPGRDVRLCTVHEVLRAQALPRRAGFSRHFRMLALAEAGCGRADDGFEVDAVVRHVSVFDTLMTNLAAIDMHFGRRRAIVHSGQRHGVLGERVHNALARALPWFGLEHRPLHASYYDGLRVLIDATTPGGESVDVGDVGRFDWMAKLCANRRYRLIASGFGLQLGPLRFRDHSLDPDPGSNPERNPDPGSR